MLQLKKLLSIFAKKSLMTMRRTSFFYKMFDLYYDGFRHMKLGKTLWLIIGIKLFVIFCVLKIFFFPNFLKQHAQEGREADFVTQELEERSVLE